MKPLGASVETCGVNRSDSSDLTLATRRYYPRLESLGEVADRPEADGGHRQLSGGLGGL